MALVAAAILAVEQVRVDRQGAVTQAQEEYFVWDRKEISLSCPRQEWAVYGSAKL